MLKPGPRVGIAAILATAWLLPGHAVECRQKSTAPVADVFEVMALATGGAMSALWPEFRVAEIPVLVYDGLDTYLFHARTIPDGFLRADKDPGALVYGGQHPQIRGNSVIRLGDAWVATSVLSASSRRTGERYALKDMAGIIVHEQFHVFQRTRHPGWRANDGVLLRYPAETAEALFLRRIEKEAFKRAVVSEGREGAAGWATLALRYREERMSGLAPAFVLYEKELQRSEGLSDYIERIARGSDPLDASSITKGIAPGGIRDLGYVEGRWIAMILDKLDPDWKAVLEKGDGLYLEDVLRTALQEQSAESVSLGGSEREAVKAASKSDFDAWQARKKEEIKEYLAAPGFRVEIKSLADPLAIRIFDPLEMEIQDDGGVFHRVVFSAAHEGGSLRIQNRPCLAYFNDAARVTRLLIHGLKQAPQVFEADHKVVLNEDGVSLEMKYSKLSQAHGRYSIEL